LVSKLVSKHIIDSKIGQYLRILLYE